MHTRSESTANAVEPRPPKIALVTGAAQGIGRAIAIRLAGDGLDVAINDLALNMALLETLSNEITAQGRRSCIVCADISVEAHVKDMVNTVVEALGGLDVVRLPGDLDRSFTPIRSLRWWPTRVYSKQGVCSKVGSSSRLEMPCTLQCLQLYDALAQRPSITGKLRSTSTPRGRFYVTNMPLLR